MAEQGARPALLDIAAGVVAIAVVVGSSIASNRIGYDFRGIFALTGAAFFLAGFVRGRAAGSLVWKTVRVSVGGFLGTAVLLMNNGLHRVSILAGLAVMALALSAAGLHARECWRSARRRSVGLIAISLFLAALAVFFMVPRLSTYSAFEARDNAAPSFSLVADDHTMSSSEFHGRVAVLAFWTSWCLPCAKELPELQRVYKRFQNDPRVVFLAVDTGWGGETAEAGRRCLAGRHLALPMAFDSGPAAQVLGVDALPGLVLIDPDSRVRFVHYGYDVSENLEMVLTGKIEGLLNEGGR